MCFLVSALHSTACLAGAARPARVPRELQACAVQALGFPRWAAGGDASAGACRPRSWGRSCPVSPTFKFLPASCLCKTVPSGAYVEFILNVTYESAFRTRDHVSTLSWGALLPGFCRDVQSTGGAQVFPQQLSSWCVFPTEHSSWVNCLPSVYTIFTS